MVDIILQLPWRMRECGFDGWKFLFKEEFHEVANHVFWRLFAARNAVSNIARQIFDILRRRTSVRIDEMLRVIYTWWWKSSDDRPLRNGANKPLHIITVSKVNSLDRFLTFAILQWWNDAMMKQVTLIWSHLQTWRHWVVIVMLISGGQCYKHSVDDLLSALIYTIQGVARRD